MKVPNHSVESVIAELGKPFGLTTDSNLSCDGLTLNTSKPRILLLNGSLRPHSFSRMMTKEASRILETFGAETRIFDATGLPSFDTDIFDSGETVQHEEDQGPAKSGAKRIHLSQYHLPGARYEGTA